MKIHTDRMSAEDIRQGLAETVEAASLEMVEKGSRLRATSFEFRIAASPGKGRRRRNSGVYGAEEDFHAAATWDEHGAFFARLFEFDPDAIVGPYEGRDDFNAQTDNRYRRNHPTTKGAATWTQ